MQAPVGSIAIPPLGFSLVSMMTQALGSVAAVVALVFSLVESFVSPWWIKSANDGQ
jgi:hypothetical protein